VVHAMSKNATNTTRTPVSAACLITHRTYVRVISDATNRKRRRSQSAPTVSTIGVPIQKCPELDPLSPLGAYDGRGKWAAVAVMAGSVDPRSVTTPSSLDEAHAERRHAINKTSTARHTRRLFTKPNLLSAEPDATSGSSTTDCDNIKTSAKTFCAEREARL
jgi:hypothetical protein